jgi:hypothetical protein
MICSCQVLVFKMISAHGGLSTAQQVSFAGSGKAESAKSAIQIAGLAELKTRVEVP